MFFSRDAYGIALDKSRFDTAIENMWSWIGLIRKINYSRKPTKIKQWTAHNSWSVYRKLVDIVDIARVSE